jgi:hypothetical protein
MNNIVITNIELPENGTINSSFKVYFFNPWGFSKKGIKNQIGTLATTIRIEAEDKIYFCIKDLFFGNRSQIAFAELKKFFLDNRVERIDLPTLRLLFDESSV